MIKRIILDIDNTLVPWEDAYNIEICNALKQLNIEYTVDDYNKILEAFDKYEDEYFIFDRELMSKFINKYTNKNYPVELIYEITKRWESAIPEKLEDGLVETLNYLEGKYDLVVLTDWYADQQLERLKKLEIDKYFSQIYSAEKIKRKPFKEAFMQAIGDNKPEECVMIGDNIKRDIKGALDAGLKAIYYNPNKKITDIKCLEITKIKQLKEIL